MELLIRLMRLLWYMELAGVVVLLLRLAYLQVYRRYPALMLFLGSGFDWSRWPQL